MSTRRVLLIMAFIPALAAGSEVSAQGNNPQPGHWSCSSANENKTVYVSAVFDETALMGEVQNGFSQLLVNKYGFKGAVFCGQATMSGSTLAGLQAGWKDQTAQLRKAGNTVIETGWIFSPASASLPYVCSAAVTVRKGGQSENIFYLTGALGVPGSVYQDLMQAWRDYLKGLHPGSLFNPQVCNLLAADPATRQSQITNLTDQWKQSKYAITQVNWAYHSGQGAAAAASAASLGTGYYCQMISADSKTWYVSPVDPLEGTWTATTYNTAWLNYSWKTLKLDPAFFRGGCESGPVSNERDARDSRKEQINGMAGGKVFEVDWKYTPGQQTAPAVGAAPTPAAAGAPGPTPAPSTAAPAPSTPATPATAPAAPPPKPQESAYLCRSIYRPADGQRESVYYMSDVFTSTTSLATINQSWQQHLVHAYHLDSEAKGQCTPLSPNPAAQKNAVNAMTNAAKASKAKIVKVSWRL